MARIDVIMPQMGESIAEGTLSKWLKQVGDAVKRDEPIFEISTDKVDAEIPAPNAGTLAEILVQEGETVEVNTVVARIETEAGAVAAAPPAEAPARPATAPEPAAAAAPPPPPPAPAPAPIPAAARAPAAGDGAGAETTEERLRRRSTPLVRKMAAEHDLDISVIPGTGMAGRVTKQDVLTYLETRPTAAPSPPTAAGGPVVAEVHAPLVDAWEGDRVEPWSRIRKLTADHMVMSRRVSAHVASVFEIDYTRVAQVRARLKKDYADRGVNLTYLAFITKAVADNVRNHPVVNAAVSGDNTIYRRDVNVGIAVALEWGLIVPVIKHADELSLIGIARAINDLGERARTKKLNPDEVQKGTFTITNPGVFGSLTGVPIINQPQTAILAVGSITKQPAVVSLPDGTDALGIRTKGMLSMSYDHRVVDGADADRFLADVRATLENFPDTAA
ncbi:MAG: 2-oxoglutarate dehydrogenase, E2 component, dihydrolipoamide succinyltransferase [Gemmatimonadales bacterium]|nr:2-oxoglutarate dehydrogenase, E2 component, dihydrolipoamide succinyltransferase [Gemmatimonadales bacterium]